MARPLSQETTKQTLVARMRAGPQADHKAPTPFLGPTLASSTLHPASRRTMEILVPVHAKLAAHTTRHVVVRYGLVPTAREPVLNRQCGHPQAIGYTTQVYQGSLLVTTGGTPGPHRSHKKGFLYSHRNPT